MSTPRNATVPAEASLRLKSTRLCLPLPSAGNEAPFGASPLRSPTTLVLPSTTALK